MKKINLSIVIPSYNEEESLPILIKSIHDKLKNKGIIFEIIIIDDGSSDKTWNEIKILTKKFTNIFPIKFIKNYGKSDALDAGFKSSIGNYVLTMDADLQDDPEEIHKLYEVITEKDFDLVSGWKKKRNDPLSKTIPSKFFNMVTRVFSGIKLNDFNCGIKIYKKKVIDSINLYGEMHRYIPLIAKWNGYNNIGEKEVNHNKRKFGKTKFGMERYIRGFLDLLSVSFVYRFRKRPMHFFGLFGTIILLIGFIFSIYLGIDKLFINKSGRLITERPEFFISLATMVIGLQFFLAGFLGELILRTRKRKDKYTIIDRS